MLHYISMSELCQAAENRHKLIREIVLEDQAAQLEKEECELISTMEENLTVMLEAIENGSKADVRSMSGLSGGDAYRLKQVIDEGKHLCGDLLSNAVHMAMAVSEINAAMGKIVAAPTAGSCGILPGALGALLKVRKIAREDVILSLFTAGAIGMVVANKASIAGASGGCQAECGTASAMAAACIVEALKRVGDGLPSALRETAEGGLAVTPAGKAFERQVFGTRGSNTSPSCAACGSCS